MEKEKVKEYKIQNCFLLRQLLTTLITVLVGGLVGLILVERSIIGAIIFVFGVYFLFVFVISFIRTNIELNKYLYSNQRRKQ